MNLEQSGRAPMGLDLVPTHKTNEPNQMKKGLELVIKEGPLTLYVEQAQLRSGLYNDSACNYVVLSKHRYVKLVSRAKSFQILRRQLWPKGDNPSKWRKSSGELGQNHHLDRMERQLQRRSFCLPTKSKLSSLRCVSILWVVT